MANAAPTTAPVSIRAATASDVSAASALLVAAWHATYDDLYGSAKVDEITARWHSPDTLSAQINAPDSAFLIAECERRLVATSFARRIETDTVMLFRIYVSPDALGTGIGTTLLHETLSKFKGASRVRLEVAPQNARAIGFYRRHGFSKIGSVSSCGSDSGLAADIYEKSLGAALRS